MREHWRSALRNETAMTLRTILSWWRQDLVDYWRARHAQPASSYPNGKEGRMVRFSRRGVNMGHTSYTVWARRGGFVIGRLEYRNQWGYYAFYPMDEPNSQTPLNMEIIAEIYAMLRELRGAR